jgi:hypothetical protein
MKRFAIPVLYLFLLSTFAFAADNSAASAKDTKFLADYLKQTKKDFLKSIDGLSDEQWKFKPSPEKWSVAEIAEHIALSEDFLGSMIAEKVLKSPPASEELKAKTKGGEDVILQRITDRTNKAQAPEQLKPTNKWTTRKDLEEAFKTKRDAHVKLAKSTPESELRNHVSPSPVGDFDGYQWLLFVAAHSKRHTAQIEEVKADPNFPKK